MFRATILPIFRSTRMCVTVCDITHPRCCRPATSWVHYTTSYNTHSSAPEDGQNNCPKHVELTEIINKPLLLHLDLTQFWQIPRQNAFLFTVNAIFLHDYPLAVDLGSTQRPLVKKKNLERFSTYWYAPFCHVCLGCCAVEFRNPGGTYE